MAKKCCQFQSANENVIKKYREKGEIDSEELGIEFSEIDFSREFISDNDLGQFSVKREINQMALFSLFTARM